MLSVKYHLSYWAISATAAVVYHALVATVGWNEANFRKLLVPLAAYTLYLVYTGPRIRSKPWHICHFAAIGCLVVSLGAITEYFFIPGVSVTPIKGVIHTILAFSAIGALEPLRQNRKDIEPCGAIGSIMILGPRIETQLPHNWKSGLGFLSTQLYTNSVLYVISRVTMRIIDQGLGYTYGPETSCMSIWNAHKSVDVPFSSVIMIFFVVGPLLDVSETIFYLAHRHMSPKWMPKPGPLVRPNASWHPMSHGTMGPFFGWMLFLVWRYRSTFSSDRHALSAGGDL
ncbi:hypothetical protein EDB80DRAFT_891603 [Ilyonectria destructans]|nr:hypothetical protein EDB80DRAFT_891603 [Ilyonectria destructans]